MIVVYGENTPLYTIVKRWLPSFVDAGQALKMTPGPGRPSDAVCEENCHAVENIMLQNRRVNVHQIADTVAIRLV